MHAGIRYGQVVEGEGSPNVNKTQKYMPNMNLTVLNNLIKAMSCLNGPISKNLRYIYT